MEKNLVIEPVVLKGTGASGQSVATTEADLISTNLNSRPEAPTFVEAAVTKIEGHPLIISLEQMIQSEVEKVEEAREFFCHGLEDEENRINRNRLEKFLDDLEHLKVFVRTSVSSSSLSKNKSYFLENVIARKRREIDTLLIELANITEAKVRLYGFENYQAYRAFLALLKKEPASARLVSLNAQEKMSERWEGDGEVSWVMEAKTRLPTVNGELTETQKEFDRLGKEVARDYVEEVRILFSAHIDREVEKNSSSKTKLEKETFLRNYYRRGSCWIGAPGAGKTRSKREHDLANALSAPTVNIDLDVIRPLLFEKIKANPALLALTHIPAEINVNHPDFIAAFNEYAKTVVDEILDLTLKNGLPFDYQKIFKTRPLIDELLTKMAKSRYQRVDLNWIWVDAEQLIKRATCRARGVPAEFQLDSLVSYDGFEECCTSEYLERMALSQGLDNVHVNLFSNENTVRRVYALVYNRLSGHAPSLLGDYEFVRQKMKEEVQNFKKNYV